MAHHQILLIEEAKVYSAKYLKLIRKILINKRDSTHEPYACMECLSMLRRLFEDAEDV